jgi:uncharacterized protein YjbI with pentapeptide repeats
MSERDLLMADNRHFDRLRAGVTGWNQWRTAEPFVLPDLSDADLSGVDMTGADLSESSLNGAALLRAKLSGADLRGSDLRGANFTGARLDGVKLSRSTIDIHTCFDGIEGCEIGVNGIYSPLNDSAALMRLDPPGNTMQGSNAEAVVESLRHARKLHTFSLLLAGIALLFIVMKPKTITLPYLAGSFRFDDFSYAFLATLLSTAILSQVASFIDSALQGARYLNDRRAAMLVGHFPWVLSKFESDPAGKRQSRLLRMIIIYHPLIYGYFFVHWSALAIGDWDAVILHYQQMPVIFGEYLLPLAAVLLVRICLQIFRLSEGFQKPILFDSDTERNRRTDMERLAEAFERQGILIAELLDVLKKNNKEENKWPDNR